MSRIYLLVILLLLPEAPESLFFTRQPEETLLKTKSTLLHCSKPNSQWKLKSPRWPAMASGHGHTPLTQYIQATLWGSDGLHSVNMPGSGHVTPFKQAPHHLDIHIAPFLASSHLLAPGFSAVRSNSLIEIFSPCLHGFEISKKSHTKSQLCQCYCTSQQRAKWNTRMATSTGFL